MSRRESGAGRGEGKIPSLANRTGLLLGGLAVVFWSFGSALVWLGAREAGTWAFVAIGSLTGGALQLGLHRAAGGKLRNAFVMPWRLWVVPLACFVVYGLVWPCALSAASSKEVFGVSLINYLWPVLTVLFSVWWVPGVRLTWRLITALLLAVSGLALANLQPLRELILTHARPTAPTWRHALPYLLALMAAVTWAVYSSILARWREWARQYVTSPLGFLLIGLIALAVLLRFGQVGHLGGFGLGMTLLYGAGPLAAGYLLWELALSRARVQTLGLLAAGTPVLSTALLCVFLRTLPGFELIMAALLVGAAAVLSLQEESGQDHPGESSQHPIAKDPAG